MGEMELLVERELAEKTEVLGENSPQVSHFGDLIINGV
jgi:hypothetical protein